jgi:ABC-type Fe3+-siderophore transport system permease subunit
VAGNSVAGWGPAASPSHGSEHSGDHHEPITSPDQHKPMVSPRLARLGAILTIILLPILAFVGNHEGNVEKVWLVGIAGFMLLMLIVDAILRKLGLRN